MGEKDDEIARLRRRVAELEQSRLSSDPVMRSLAEASPDSLMLLDTEGNIQFINRTVPDLTIDQVLGTPVYNYVPPDQHAPMRACFERVLASGEPDRYDNVYHRQDGGVSFWESRVGPVKRDGKVTGLAVLASDVSERHEAAADRDRLFQVSVDMLCVADFEGLFRRLNPACERVLGHTPDEMQGQPLATFVHPDDLDATNEAMARLSEGQDVIDFMNRYRCKDGHYKTLSWHATADLQGGLVYAAARDVTERLALESQLRESQKMDAVGQLAGGIAHDFNNLLLVIMGNADFAGASLGKPREAELRLAEIQKACTRASELTRQLLTFSRRQPMQTRPLQLNDVIGQVLKMLERLLPENIAMDFQGGDQLAVVEADSVQLEQVLMNLCLNARDAMQGGGHITVKTENVTIDGRYQKNHPWARPGRYALVSVCDTGTGMPTEVRDRVFEPFFTTKAPGEGTGLGLATAYGIVQRHAGMIQVQSVPGEGTTFSIYLPVARGGSEVQDDRRQGDVAGGSETILVVEDQVEVRQVVVQILERAGYRVLQASNGAEALECFGEHREEIALLVMDVIMPVMSGPDAYADISSKHGEVPVIFSSGYSDSQRVGSRLPAGAILLQKPYPAGDLLRAVRAAMDGKASSRTVA